MLSFVRSEIFQGRLVHNMIEKINENKDSNKVWYLYFHLKLYYYCLQSCSSHKYDNWGIDTKIHCAVFVSSPACTLGNLRCGRRPFGRGFRGLATSAMSLDFCFGRLLWFLFFRVWCRLALPGSSISLELVTSAIKFSSPVPLKSCGVCRALASALIAPKASKWYRLQVIQLPSLNTFFTIGLDMKV